jgi:hypothetical protein
MSNLPVLCGAQALSINTDTQGDTQMIKRFFKSIIDSITEAQMRKAERMLACYKKNGSLGGYQ